METNSIERLPVPPPSRWRVPDAAPLTPAVAPTHAFALERAGWQWLPVSAHIRERYLVTFRAPAERSPAWYRRR